MKRETQLCEWGMMMGECFDEYPPSRIWKGIHEVGLPKDGKFSVIHVCSDCLNFYYINDDEKEEGEDYELDCIDNEALKKWDDDRPKRDVKRASYLEKWYASKEYKERMKRFSN